MSMMARPTSLRHGERPGETKDLVQEASRSRGPLEQGRYRLAQVHATRQRTGSRVKHPKQKK